MSSAGAHSGHRGCAHTRLGYIPAPSHLEDYQHQTIPSLPILLIDSRKSVCQTACWYSRGTAVWSGISASIGHRRFWDICRGNRIAAAKKHPRHLLRQQQVNEVKWKCHISLSIAAAISVFLPQHLYRQDFAAAMAPAEDLPRQLGCVWPFVTCSYGRGVLLCPATVPLSRGGAALGGSPHTSGPAVRIPDTPAASRQARIFWVNCGTVCKTKALWTPLSAPI